jgi:Zn-finger nucleic acid-binding protein
MRVVRVPAKTGYYLLLDQCTRCGGVWCDRWELYPLDATASEIDDADTAALLSPLLPQVSPLHCPHCDLELTRFSDPTWPADAQVERCRRCGGMWLNRGELRRIKRKDRHAAARPAPAPALAPRAPEYWPTVERLDDATQQPVESIGENELRPQLLAGAAWIAARLLLRWFLGL